MRTALNTLVQKYVFISMNRNAQKEQFAHIFVAFKRMCVTDVGCTANSVLHQIVAFFRIVLCIRLSMDLRLKQDWKSFQSC